MKRRSQQFDLKKIAWKKKFLSDGCSGCIVEYRVFCEGKDSL